MSSIGWKRNIAKAGADDRLLLSSRGTGSGRDYIHEHNPPAAYRFIRELRGRCRKLSDAPLKGVARPEFGAALRSFPYRRYVVFYSISEQEIRIERVIHGARDIGAVLET